MQKSIHWGANSWHRMWLVVLSIWAGKARYIVTKLLNLDMISEKQKTPHQNAQETPHGKALVLFLLGKESVEITSKKWQGDRGISVCFPPPGGAIAATKSMSLTCTTPLSSLHQKQKWLFFFFFISLPNPQTQWICLLSLHKLPLMDSVKHPTLCLCY